MLPPLPPPPKREEMFTNSEKYKRDCDTFLSWLADFTVKARDLAELVQGSKP